MSKWIIVSAWLFVILSSGGIVFIAHRYEQKCDEHIVLNDGREYDCKDVTSLDNNMTYIVTCDDKRISFPTISVKEVNRIK